MRINNILTPLFSKIREIFGNSKSTREYYCLLTKYCKHFTSNSLVLSCLTSLISPLAILAASIKVFLLLMEKAKLLFIHWLSLSKINDIFLRLVERKTLILDIIFRESYENRHCFCNFCAIKSSTTTQDYSRPYLLRLNKI